MRQVAPSVTLCSRHAACRLHNVTLDRATESGVHLAFLLLVTDRLDLEGAVRHVEVRVETVAEPREDRPGPAARECRLVDVGHNAIREILA